MSVQHVPSPTTIGNLIILTDNTKKAQVLKYTFAHTIC